MGRLGLRGGSGVGEDGIGFEGFQVRELGSGRSKELGGWGRRGWSWGRRSLGQEVKLESRKSVGLGLGKLGLRGGYERLGLRGWVYKVVELIRIRGVGVAGDLCSKELE